MKKVLIINGGQNFGHSGGKYNQTIAENTLEVLKNFENVEVAEEGKKLILKR